MTALPAVRVAAVQATPVILDAEAAVEIAERFLHEAADDGVQLAVLPEAFVSLNPAGRVSPGGGHALQQLPADRPGRRPAPAPQAATRSGAARADALVPRIAGGPVSEARRPPNENPSGEAQG